MIMGTFNQGQIKRFFIVGGEEYKKDMKNYVIMFSCPVPGVIDRTSQ